MHERYDSFMREAPAHIVLRIEIDQPIELLDFVATFTALANQFDKYMRTRHPHLDADARIFVREIRSGSIEADLIPWAIAIISQLDRILIVEEFMRVYASRLSMYFRKGGRAPDASKSDLDDFMRAVTAIANDPDGKCSIKAARFNKGEREVTAALEFDTEQARRATEEIEAHRKELKKPSGSDHENVLMRFYQPNRKDVDKSGEKVIIEAIMDKPRPIVYASDLARQRIKSEMLHGDRNIFKLGFFVDVNVETVRGRVAAYRLTDVRDVIELPPDIDD